jgi:hypothetical protein
MEKVHGYSKPARKEVEKQNQAQTQTRIQFPKIPLQILSVEITQRDRDQVAKTLITPMYPRRLLPRHVPLDGPPRSHPLRLAAVSVRTCRTRRLGSLKVVDPETQEAVSYARYLLPPAVIAELESEKSGKEAREGGGGAV